MSENFSINDSVKIYIIAFFLMLASSFSLLLTEGERMVYLSFLLPQLCYLLVIFLYVKFYKRANLLDIVLLKKRAAPVSYLLAVPTAFGIYLAFAIVGIAFSWILDRFSLNVDIELPSFNTPFSVILSIIIICILPALGEESMFRGVFLSGLSAKGQRYAVVMSAFLFALSHLNLTQFIYQFIIGFFLSYITARTENIRYAMIIHFLNNLTVLVLPVIIPSYNDLGVFSLLNIGILAIMSVIGLVILAICLPLIIKTATSRSNKANILQFLFKKTDKTCYNNVEGSAMLTGLICTMIVVAILTSIIG